MSLHLKLGNNYSLLFCHHVKKQKPNNIINLLKQFVSGGRNVTFE